MVTIPEHGDPTLQVMLRAVEAQQFGRQDRNYLGASMIGEPCARKIWYKYNKYPELPSGAIGLMAAESGYYAEEVTAKRLRMVSGIELHTHKMDGSQYGWSAIGGKFKGHVDGLVRGLFQASSTVHVWEHKDKDHKKFADFKNKKDQFGEKNALKNWNEIYYGQAQINMHYMQNDRHYLTVSYAGARDYDSCRTDYSPVVAEQLVDKAHKIIDATFEPPRINDKPDFFLCKFCSFREICHGQR
jgi:hypothetical protein